MTSHSTFSAAANLATELDVRTSALFVGEPMGGGLNFYGDGTFVILRSLPLPLVVPVPRIHWQKAPGDERLTIEPDIPAPITARDYFSGRDAALDGILAFDAD